MSIITLITDYGTKDSSVGVLKGLILKENLNIQIVDVSHHIEPFNIFEASYKLISILNIYPKNTVHIISVDAESKKNRRYLLAEIEGQMVISSDNGIFSFIASEKKIDRLTEIVALEKIDREILSTDKIFAKVSGFLSKGGEVKKLGETTNNFREIITTQPQVENRNLHGNIIYIDHYGNLVTNIKKSLFLEIVGDKSFELDFRGYKFSEVFKKYSDFELNFPEDQKADGEGFLVFNSLGFLEIVIYKSNLKSVGGASTLLGAKINDHLTISF